MQLFGALHLSLLAAIGVIATVLAVLCRRRVLAVRSWRIALGCALVVNELIWWTFRYAHEGIHLPSLPLQLCDITMWMSAVACLTVQPLVVEFAFFAGLAGAGMALLTPDLFSPWPTYPAIYFFIAHGGIVVAVVMLVGGGVVKLRPGAVWRAFGMLLLYAGAIGIFNAISGANYMYLCRKPVNATALDALGPWPAYLVVGAAVALALFWLLWLPVRPREFLRK